MEKYNGNQKGFIYVSCDNANQQEVFEKYIGPLAKGGISFWWADGFDSKEEKNLERASAALVFLTNDYVKEAKLRDTITASVKNNKPVLCVYLEDVELDAALSMQTEAQQALFVNKYKNDEEFIEDLKKAAIFGNVQLTKKQKSIQRNRTLAVVAVAAAVLVAAVIIVKPLLGSRVNEDTMGALGLRGVSQEELESIEELHIVGHEVMTSDVFDVFANYDEDNTSITYEIIREDGSSSEEKTTTPGTISDLAGLDQLKNLRELEIEGQQIEDITPLLKLENLEELSLRCNPVSSVDGLERLNKLRWIDISFTNITEFPKGVHLQEIRARSSALTTVPDLSGMSDVWFEADNGTERLSNVSNLSTAESYSYLALSVNGNETEIIESLKGIPINSFCVEDMQINSLEALSGFDVKESLNIYGGSISSLDGIEHFEGINLLALSLCTELTDLSPVNKLKSLKHLYISEDMADMADQVDDRIEVIIE